MPARISFVVCGVLLFASALASIWVTWHDDSLHNAWTLDESMRTFADFAPGEKIDASFRLCNTAPVPLRILGASAC